MSAKVYEESKLANVRLFDYGKEYKLDKNDKKILDLLNKNARLSLADLSRKSGITRDVIGYRIKKMENENLLLGFRPVFNPSKLGLPVINHVYFLVQPKSVEEEKKFISHLKTNKNVIGVYSLVGKWEFMATIVAANPAEFNEILKDIRIKFPELIKDYETMGILEEFKHDNYEGFFWK